MKRETAATDHVLALTLKIGAYSAFTGVVLGILLRLAWPAIGEKIMVAGILILLATPVLRIVVACIQFLREHDRKYALISLGVLCIVVLAYFLGVQA